MGVPERFGNHFGCPPKEGLWVSSFVVPSRVGLRAGNMVDALVGFSASLQPNQNAYTKVIQSKAAEFRPHICMSSTNMLGGIYTPNLCYIMTIMPLPARNILGRKSFHTGWSVQIIYPIRFVIETLLRSVDVTFGSAVDLRSLS